MKYKKRKVDSLVHDALHFAVEVNEAMNRVVLNVGQFRSHEELVAVKEHLQAKARHVANECANYLTECKKGVKK